MSHDLYRAARDHLAPMRLTYPIAEIVVRFENGKRYVVPPPAKPDDYTDCDCDCIYVLTESVKPLTGEAVIDAMLKAGKDYGPDAVKKALVALKKRGEIINIHGKGYTLP